MLSKRTGLVTTATAPIPEETSSRMAEELGFGRWMMRFALYGDEAVVDHRFAKIKDAFETAIPGARGLGHEARRRTSIADTRATRASACRAASRASTSTR